MSNYLFHKYISILKPPKKINKKEDSHKTNNKDHMSIVIHLVPKLKTVQAPICQQNQKNKHINHAYLPYGLSHTLNHMEFKMQNFRGNY